MAAARNVWLVLAVVDVLGLLADAAAELRAQTAVEIDADDTPTCRRGSSELSSPTIRVAMSCPTCPRYLQGLGARLRPDRLAEGPTGCRAASSPCVPCRHPTRSSGGPVLTTRPSTGMRCSTILEAQPVRQHERHPGPPHAHRLAEAGEEHRLHRLPSARTACPRARSQGARRV